MARLIEKAEERGYSRRARGYAPSSDKGDWCAVVAILYEATPEPAHVCLVWPKGSKESYRLDISLKDYARLDRLSRIQQAEVMQRLMLKVVRKGTPEN